MLKSNIKRIWANLTSAKKNRVQNYAHQQEKFKTQYPNYTIGRATYGIPVVYDYHEGTTLKIGAYCSIASHVQIYLGGNHRTDWLSSYPFPFFFQMDERYKNNYGGSRGDVTIGSDVWLCANCTILSGVTIGHGAVIANGAVISRDVEPYAIMAGNPAKLIKWRFDEPTRKALLESKWWEWPEDEIKKILNMLCSSNLTEFINYSKTREITHSKTR